MQQARQEDVWEHGWNDRNYDTAALFRMKKKMRLPVVVEGFLERLQGVQRMVELYEPYTIVC